MLKKYQEQILYAPFQKDFILKKIQELSTIRVYDENEKEIVEELLERYRFMIPRAEHIEQIDRILYKISIISFFLFLLFLIKMSVTRESYENSEKTIITLINRQNREGIENYVVIFDIDDTLIDKKQQEICPVIRSLHYAQLYGFKIGIITARPDIPPAVKYTMSFLKKKGIQNIAFWKFRPINEQNLSFYKEQARKSIEAEGYHIFMSIGDKEWDVGKYGGYGIIVS